MNWISCSLDESEYHSEEENKKINPEKEIFFSVEIKDIKCDKTQNSHYKKNGHLIFENVSDLRAKDKYIILIICSEDSKEKKKKKGKTEREKRRRDQ